jgi:hypothetical protein
VTIPKVDKQDFNAIHGVQMSVSKIAKLTKIENVGGAQEASYLVKVGVLHRKHLDWIGFPLVLEVNDFNFRAAGIYQNKVILICDDFETALPTPTGSEPWSIYLPLTDKYDNYYFDVSCSGDAAAIDRLLQPIPISLNWSISATVIADRNLQALSWNSSQDAKIRNEHST